MMARQTINHVKLGIFVMAGLGFLILLLYMIGKNQNLFGKTFELKARFSNARGLMWGNNVRFAGIDAGTVTDIEIINDSTIEITMRLENEIRKHIRKNATASIGTDGLMGNKLVNIEPAEIPAEPVQSGDILSGIASTDTDEMLRILNKTNSDLYAIASSLKTTVGRINESKAVWAILEDSSLPMNVKNTFSEFNQASKSLHDLMGNLELIVGDIRSGKGSLGRIISDTGIADGIEKMIEQMSLVGTEAESLAKDIHEIVNNIEKDINQGEGSVNLLLKDKSSAEKLSMAIENIEKGTKAFEEDMKALRNNFLFRSYFKKQEKKSRKNP
jgi:phospholipid/cholesterol/gamma-HCH transport system substrate-binding protein